jgi:hypothetical protein
VNRPPHRFPPASPEAVRINPTEQRAGLPPAPSTESFDGEVTDPSGIPLDDLGKARASGSGLLGEQSAKQCEQPAIPDPNGEIGIRRDSLQNRGEDRIRDWIGLTRHGHSP